MTNAPRLALVGTGSMGSLHARVIAQSDRAELTRVVDPREEAGRTVAERYGARWTPELGDLSDVDAVVLAAPTGVHHELALPILAAGKPLLIEKPVAPTVEQSEAIVAAAEDRGLPLMCGFVERYNPAVLTVQALLEAPVHVAAVRHSPYAHRIRTGVAWDLLIHDVDAAIRMMRDTPVQVRGALGFFHPDSAPGAEDVADAVMSFTGSRVATASASRIYQRKVRTLTVSEVNRTIEVDLLRRDVTIYHDGANEAFASDNAGYRQQTVIEIPELVTAREPLAAQLDRFLGLLDDTVDLKEERDSILPAHRAVGDACQVPPASRLG
jgi:predicted dehydrogenase